MRVAIILSGILISTAIRPNVITEDSAAFIAIIFILSGIMDIFDFLKNKKK